MTTLPAELVTLLGSSMLASASKMVGLHLKARRQERLRTLQLIRPDVPPRVLEKPLKSERSSLQWTRRIIALTAVFSSVVLPKLIGLWRPDILIHIAYFQPKSGWFCGDLSQVAWVHLQGVVITPLDTHLLCAVIGLYFGGSFVNAQA
jgi:hypothetical protein